jgi:hypothetical protein
MFTRLLRTYSSLRGRAPTDGVDPALSECVEKSSELNCGTELANGRPSPATYPGTEPLFSKNTLHKQSKTITRKHRRAECFLSRSPLDKRKLMQPGAQCWRKDNVFRNYELFVPQRDGRFDRHCSPRWQQSAKQGHEAKKNNHGPICHCVESIYPIKKNA